MPPPIRDVDRFASVLGEFVAFEIVVSFCTVANRYCSLFYSGEDGHEVVYGFIILVFANEAFTFDDISWRAGREEHPSFLSVDESVPRARSERVNMYSRSRSFGAYEEPSIGGAASFTDEVKKIFVKVRGDLIIVLNSILAW